MTSAPIFIDLTELVANPLRTGIQRVEREIIRHWPGPRPLAPCRFDSVTKTFVSLPEAVMDILGSEAAPPGEAEKELLDVHLPSGRPISNGDLANGLFNPEVFFDPARAEAYRGLCRQQPNAAISWLVYDFLPYLFPQYFPSGTTRHCMNYICAMREAPRVAFISEKTRSEYVNRVIRNPLRAGPILPLGGDGLCIQKARFDSSKKLFVHIGTIEPRKNVAAILMAFELMWRGNGSAKLLLIGRSIGTAMNELSIIERLKDEAYFSYLGHTDDATIRSVLCETRATISVSSAEGFGIPPWESLAAGVPVIASKNIPSIDLLPPGGRIMLEEVSPEAIAQAVSSLLDDEFAAKLWKEAAELTIPTWKEFGADLAKWLHRPCP